MSNFEKNLNLLKLLYKELAAYGEKEEIDLEDMANAKFISECFVSVDKAINVAAKWNIR